MPPPLIPPSLAGANPIHPDLPTTWMKNLPTIMITLGAGLGSVGVWFQTKVLNDPTLTDQFGDWANVPGILAAISGAMIAFGSPFVAKLNQDKTEKVVEKTQVVAEIAAISPSVAPADIDGVLHSLTEAQTKALQKGDFTAAQKILDVCKNLNIAQGA